MGQNPKQYDDDDGRVVCSMDVEGMRWHDKRVRREQKAMRTAAVQGDQMTRSEMRRYNWYSILAGLSIVGVFSVVWVLFVLFCTQIWFK
ncbi:MAG TPA: hypothetical protein PK040_06165 [Anaerolineaceae bacterium]|nr:hypothetical protein [Anaerolineaceae bacterium]